MHFKILLLTAVFSAAVHTTTAFPQGAPGYACKTLRPSHIGSPKTQEDEASPYRLSTNTTTLVPGGAVAGEFLTFLNLKQIDLWFEMSQF